MRTAQSMLFVLGSVGILALSACSAYDSGGSSESTTSTTQVTTSASASASAAPSSTAQPSTTEAPTSAPVTSEQPSETTSSEVPSTTQTSTTNDTGALPYGPFEPGDMTIINGEPARVCIFGDGWGTNVWAAGPNTSCKFVVATHHTLVEGQNATENNIRDFLRSPINVQSPVTGEYYDLTCAPESAELFACRGGNDAVIYFY